MDLGVGVRADPSTGPIPGGSKYALPMRFSGLLSADMALNYWALALQDGVLTIRGEKKHEHDEEKENYRMMERRYGSFQRSLRLPDTVDQDKVEASFDNGVLKIKVPKRPEAIGKQRTIPITKR
jgi:hypothetical protein